MKKIITGILLVLGMLGGGLVASVPAQAEVPAVVQTQATADAGAGVLDAGSQVRFTIIHAGIPATIDLYNTSNSGYQYTQSLGETRNSVEKSCPKNSNYKLEVTNPEGQTYYLSPGGCLFPRAGLYYVAYHLA